MDVLAALLPPLVVAAAFVAIARAVRRTDAAYEVPEDDPGPDRGGVPDSAPGTDDRPQAG